MRKISMDCNVLIKEVKKQLHYKFYYGSYCRIFLKN